MTAGEEKSLQPADSSLTLGRTEKVHTKRGGGKVLEKSKCEVKSMLSKGVAVVLVKET